MSLQAPPTGFFGHSQLLLVSQFYMDWHTLGCHCVAQVFDTVLPEHLAGRPFCDLVEWLYRTSNFVLIGAPDL